MSRRAHPDAGRAGPHPGALLSSCVLLFLLLPPAPGAAEPLRPALLPRIVNGEVTTDYDAVGALLTRNGGPFPDDLCSGTLIGCQTVLTAAHCVCDDPGTDAAECERLGTTPPDQIAFFLQHGGFLPAASVSVHPGYVFGVAADLAVVKLAMPAGGVRPSPINVSAPVPLRTQATVVGFGRTGGNPQQNRDVGIKRSGKVVTAACPSGVPGSENICWAFLGEDANTCEGDSGGPLFVVAPAAAPGLLAGVASAGESTTCLAPDRSNNTDVYVNRRWLVEQAGEDLDATLCPLFPGADPRANVLLSEIDSLTAVETDARFRIRVPPATALLRVALNGEISSPVSLRGNDFDLFLRAGLPPTELQFDCTDASVGTFGFCEVSQPLPGEWHVLVRRYVGSGQFQLVATAYAVSAACTGDCNDDSSVTVDELLVGVAIALDERDKDECPTFDRDLDGRVTVDEISQAIVHALDGCP